MDLQRNLLLLVSLLSLPALGQTVIALDEQEHAAGKAAGSITGSTLFHIPATGQEQSPPVPIEPAAKKNRSVCDLWQDPSPCVTAMGANDDGSTSFIALPFDFNLYGTQYNGLWINNNGNVTFTGPYGTFTGQAFPNTQFVMVAPFWGDVDTRSGNGVVSYCISDSRIVVTWFEVGYYNQMGDKLNTFQLILTDGQDPLIGQGNNVAFVYQDMQWTTGAASGGINGFGGSPAVVGTNLGDGISYLQIGLFDHAGTDYDGPVGNNDGVDWLDYRTFVFSTEEPAANIPPLVSGNTLCDTITICAGESFDFEMEFYSPEPTQTTSVTYSAPGLSNVVIDQNTTGVTAVFTGTINTNNDDIGMHTVTVTATDDGTPTATTEVIFVVQVIGNPGEPPVITGSDTFCEGTSTNLYVEGDYDSYQWSNGATGPSISVSAPGSYTVYVANGGICGLLSAAFELTMLPAPELPLVQGATFSCGGDPVELSTTEEYTSYQWSNGATTPTTMVMSGNHYVIVTNEFGCQNISYPHPVQVSDGPTASFIADPPSPQLPEVEVTFTSTSSGNGSTITDLVWTIGDELLGTGQTLVHFFETPGLYAVTLTVTTTEGCVHSHTMDYLVRPNEFMVTNVFSPNGDGHNETFYIENIEYFANSLIIFDRWGTPVYEASNYKNNWRANGLPDGTYFYVLRIDNEADLNGQVTILR